MVYDAEPVENFAGFQHAHSDSVLMMKKQNTYSYILSSEFSIE